MAGGSQQRILQFWLFSTPPVPQTIKLEHFDVHLQNRILRAPFRPKDWLNSQNLQDEVITESRVGQFEIHLVKLSTFPSETPRGQSFPSKSSPEKYHTLSFWTQHQKSFAFWQNMPFPNSL